MTAALKLTMTDDHYLTAERASAEKHEMLDYQVYAMAGASMKHNRITFNTTGSLGTQLKGKPCSGFSNDMRLRIRPGTYYYPDVTVVCGDADIIKDNYKDTLLNPTLLVEVLSPSTTTFDQTTKFRDYRSLPSVQEVVFIAQDSRSIVRYLRAEGDDWTFREITQPGEVLVLASIGCTLAIEDVYDKVAIEEAGEQMPADQPMESN